jgi:hypothetical protein
VSDAIGIMMTVPLTLWLRGPSARQHLERAVVLEERDLTMELR